MTLTKEQFQKLFPTINLTFVDVLIKLLPNYNINTIDRISAFISQCSHESGGFVRFIENLNYSKEGLLKTFPKYFNEDSANIYAKKPAMIANKVYANRMGNGDENSGDGWKYRGRGLIQLTGKNNYVKLLNAIYPNRTLDDVVAICEISEGIIKSSLWFWTTNKCNDYADKMDIKGLTKVINGGYIGLVERISLFNKVKSTIVV